MSQQRPDARLITVLLVAAAVLVLLPVATMAVGMVAFGPMMGGTWGGHMWADGATSGWLFVARVVLGLFVLAALLVGGYLLYRAFTGRRGGTDPALAELRLAYARGELSEEEYEQRRATLERDTNRKTGPHGNEDS